MFTEVFLQSDVIIFQTFCEMVVNEGQMVCVELVAKNPRIKEPKVLFLGSIKYEALRKVYETRVREKS